MSSILKALKKLEDEKAVHRPDTLKIDSDILKGESPRRHSATGLILAALLLFAGGSVATYLYMKQKPVSVTETSKNTTNQPGNIQSARPNPLRVPNVTEIRTEELPKAIQIVPAKQSHADQAVTAKRQKQIVDYKPTQVAAPRKHGQNRNDQQKRISAAPPVLPTAEVKTVPLLRVNGIAHQDGAADSVAVVNGVPVSDGVMIEGARVESIQKDRVRFSYKGELFEIPLGKSNR